MFKQNFTAIPFTEFQLKPFCEAETAAASLRTSFVSGGGFAAAPVCAARTDNQLCAVTGGGTTGAQLMQQGGDCQTFAQRSSVGEVYVQVAGTGGWAPVSTATRRASAQSDGFNSAFGSFHVAGGGNIHVTINHYHKDNES